MDRSTGLRRFFFVGGCARGMIALAAAAALAAAPTARATQHLVTPGDDWSKLAQKVRPGDEIILMPGRHLAVSLEDLHGTVDKPIVIRPITPAHPVEIGAREYAVRLIRPKHVILRDVTITNVTQTGISIDDGSVERPANARGSLWQAQVRIERVKILRTARLGENYPVQFAGVTGVRLDNCHIEGWAGAAIDVIACRDIEIRRAFIRGLPDFAQAAGIQVRGGSEDVRILESVFFDAGKRPVNAGGLSAPKFFRPAIPEDASAASRYEASNIRLEKCIFIGGECAVAFSSAERVSLNQCTIVRPTRWVFRYVHDHDDPRFAPGTRGILSQNLIVFDGKTIRPVVDIAAGLSPEALEFEWNLWWAEGGDFDSTRLPGRISFDQITDIDPRLDDQYRPMTIAARGFGHAVDSWGEGQPGQGTGPAINSRANARSPRPRDGR